MKSPAGTDSAREAILRRVRAALPESVPLPQLPTTGPWQTFEKPEDRFREVLESVGGRCVRVPTVQAAHEWLRNFEPWIKAAVRASVVDGLGEPTINLNEVNDPHALENVGFAVLKGHFAVAENAAVWVTESDVKHRVLYFIPQHMALAIPASQIVHNMHEAYGRVQVTGHPFCGFISGPSKTADIEQSLVIGAHGARSLVVFLIEEW